MVWSQNHLNILFIKYRIVPEQEFQKEKKNAVILASKIKLSKGNDAEIEEKMKGC